MEYSADDLHEYRTLQKVKYEDDWNVSFIFEKGDAVEVRWDDFEDYKRDHGVWPKAVLLGFVPRKTQTPPMPVVRFNDETVLEYEGVNHARLVEGPEPLSYIFHQRYVCLKKTIGKVNGSYVSARPEASFSQTAERHSWSIEGMGEPKTPEVGMDKIGTRVKVEAYEFDHRVPGMEGVISGYNHWEKMHIVTLDSKPDGYTSRDVLVPTEDLLATTAPCDTILKIGDVVRLSLTSSKRIAGTKPKIGKITCVDGKWYGVEFPPTWENRKLRDEGLLFQLKDGSGLVVGKSDLGMWFDRSELEYVGASDNAYVQGYMTYLAQREDVMIPSKNRESTDKMTLDGFKLEGKTPKGVPELSLDHDGKTIVRYTTYQTGDTEGQEGSVQCQIIISYVRHPEALEEKIRRAKKEEE